MRILAKDTEITLPNISGTIGEILSTYNIAHAGKQITLNGDAVTADISISPEEYDEIEIRVTGSEVRVIKQVGEQADIEVPYHEGMTIADALAIAMQLAGLAVNTDELTCIDYSATPITSYPAGLRTEKVRPGAELHLSAQDKYSNG